LWRWIQSILLSATDFWFCGDYADRKVLPQAASSAKADAVFPILLECSAKGRKI
jgi:hypothetical protein